MGVENPLMQDLTLRRWTRYGHDRTYVQSSDGTRLGYRDNTTGTVVMEVEDRRADVLAALEESTPAAPALPPVTVLASPPPVVPVQYAPPKEPVEPRCTDLAGRRPGQAVREQAVALRQAAPVRTLVARVLGVHTDERAYRIGADGEEAVAARLARLGPAWRVLHAVPVGRGDSDIGHVVIGPGGVFTVNAKHHPDANVWVGGNTFLVNGHRQPYVRNGRHEAQRASRLLTARTGFPVLVTG